MAAPEFTTRSKVVPLAGAVTWRQSLPGPMVFTNGVFDLLHRGHVEYLEAARGLGAGLLVAVNSDRSARQLGKGPDRPLIPEADRARLLAALLAVDRVVVFDEPTPFQLIDVLRPDILVKGGDYTAATIVGADRVETWGGRVVVVPLVPNCSTTSLVERIRGTR